MALRTVNCLTLSIQQPLVWKKLSADSLLIAAAVKSHFYDGPGYFEHVCDLEGRNKKQRQKIGIAKRDQSAEECVHLSIPEVGQKPAWEPDLEDLVKEEEYREWKYQANEGKDPETTFPPPR